MRRYVRPVIPPLVLLYAGVVLAAIPYVLRTYFPPELFINAGLLLAISGVVWWFAQRIEDRIDAVERSLADREKYLKYDVLDVGLVTRYGDDDNFRRSVSRRPRIVINKADLPALYDILRLLLERAFEATITVCDTESTTPHEHEVAVALRDLTRDKRNTIEVRSAVQRAKFNVIQTPDTLLLLIPLSAQLGIFAYVVTDTTGALGAEIDRDLQDVWSGSVQYAR